MPSSRDLSLSVIIGSLLAHCQNRLSAWIIGPPLDRVHEQLDDLSAFESNTCRRGQDDTPGARVLLSIYERERIAAPDLRRTHAACSAGRPSYGTGGQPDSAVNDPIRLASLWAA
jgi:hypothetical protein